MINPLFLRRDDIPVNLRIQIAAEAICHKKERGNIEEIAHRYKVSTSFIYELINDFIKKLQAPSPKIISSEIDFDAWSRHVLLMRLEGKVSLDSISAILQSLGMKNSSRASVSKFLSRYGSVIGEMSPITTNKKIFYLSDETFNLGRPILITIDAYSTFIFKIELADHCDEKTWENHYSKLEGLELLNLGLCSDRALPIRGGYKQVKGKFIWVSDLFHELRGLSNLLQSMKKSYKGSKNERDRCLKLLENSKSKQVETRRELAYLEACKVFEQDSDNYFTFKALYLLLKGALEFCAPSGELHKSENVKDEVLAALSMMDEIE